jgi:hypothetical protein
MNKVLLLLLAFGTLTGFSVAFAGAESGSIIVSGWVTKVDLPAGTFAIRNGKKAVQLTIDPSRTDIQVDGSVPQTSLRFVHVGAAARAKLSLLGDHLMVKSVKFTHRPATAIPVKSRPGFVFSPYSHVLFDVERCAHGDMLVDPVGKIFLVP